MYQDSIAPCRRVASHREKYDHAAGANEDINGGAWLSLVHGGGRLRGTLSKNGAHNIAALAIRLRERRSGDDIGILR